MRLFEDIKQNEESILSNYGLLSGGAGYILLLYYKKDYDILYNAIEKLVAEFDTKLYSPLYSNGLAGFLWVLETINEDENVDYLDDVIDVLKELLLKTYNKISYSNLDFLHGITGIINYFVDFYDDTYKEIINRYLKSLSDLSKRNETGLFVEFYQPVRKEYLINFGLSHGLPAIIQILSKIFKNKIEVKVTERLLLEYVEFILKSLNNFEQIGSFFSNSFQEKNIKSRLAWCYGDLGVAISIWQAGDNTSNTKWKQTAEDIFIQTTKRKLLKDGMVVDPMICHGTSGIATIFNRMWRNTDNIIFLNARNYWLNETKKFARFKDGVGGYKYFILPENKWINEYGLLEGAIGLVLTFLQAESKEDIKWDKALLIST